MPKKTASRRTKKRPSEALLACGSRLVLIMRSAVLPGLGQYRRIHYLSAGIFFSGAFGGADYTSHSISSTSDFTNIQNLVIFQNLSGKIQGYTRTRKSSLANASSIIFDSSIVSGLSYTSSSLNENVDYLAWLIPSGNKF
jgi:hypothetical protein